MLGKLLGDIEPHLLLFPLLFQLYLLSKSTDGVLLVVYFLEIFQILFLLLSECGKHEVELFLELVVVGLQSRWQGLGVACDEEVDWRVDHYLNQVSLLYQSMVDAIVEMPRRPSDSQVCFLCTCSFFNRFSTTSYNLDARLALISS